MKFRIIESVTTDIGGVATDCVFKVQRLIKLFWVIPIWSTVKQEIHMWEDRYTEVDREFKSICKAEEYIKMMYKKSNFRLGGRFTTVVKNVDSEDL